MSKNWYWKPKVVNLSEWLSVMKETAVLMESVFTMTKGYFLKIGGNEELKPIWYEKLSSVRYFRASCSTIRKCGKFFI